MQDDDRYLVRVVLEQLGALDSEMAVHVCELVLSVKKTVQFLENLVTDRCKAREQLTGDKSRSRCNQGDRAWHLGQPTCKCPRATFRPAEPRLSPG